MQTATASEIAQMAGKTIRTIQRRAKKENWPFDRVSGRGGKIKYYHITSLPTDIALLYNKEIAEKHLAQTKKTEITTTPKLAPINTTQQELAIAKASLLAKYLQRIHAAGHGKKAAARDQFIIAYNSGIPWPQWFEKIGKVAWKTIEGWKKTVEKNNGDTFALADRRGYVKRGNTTLSPENKKILLACALRPNYKTNTKGTIKHFAEIIRTARAVMAESGVANGHSDDTYRRFLKDWRDHNYHIWVFCREGAKAWNDKCAISIERDYSMISVGDVLVADGHVLNFEIINPWTGKPKRMMLLLWLDMKSSMPLGWEIMPTENTAAIASALRRAIIRLGKHPKVAYLDNGKAFASKFFNGKDLEDAGFSGLFERLDIKTIFAWPYHGQSKTVERFFGTFSELERMVPTFCGTSIDMKPARMNRGERIHRKVYEKVMGGGGISLEQAHRAIAAWFDEYAHRPQQGHLNGQCPMDVFLPEQGPGVDTLEIRFLMMAKEVKKIYQNGIRFQNQFYYHPALYGRKESVQIRYDLQDPSSILVMDPASGDLLCEAVPTTKAHPAATVLGTAADREHLSTLIKYKKSQEKEASALARNFLETDVLPEHRRQMAKIGIVDPPDNEGRHRDLPLQEKTDTEIMAEYEESMAGTAALREIEKQNTDNEVPALQTPYIDEAAVMFKQLDNLQEVDRYEKLIELDVRGILIPKRHQYFMQYFENMPSYETYQDHYETVRAQAAEKWQIDLKKEDVI